MKDFTAIIRKLARYLHLSYLPQMSAIRAPWRFGARILCVLCAFVVIIFAGAVSAEFGCGQEKEAGRNERVLRIGGLGGKPGPINQIITNQTVSSVLHELVFSRLVWVNSRMMPQVDLAGRWDVSPDGLNYTFYLRKGVRFHDGIEMTSEDCKFTYDAVLDPVNNSPWRDTYNIIKELKAKDRYTLMIILKEPRASFINLMNFSILPKHLLDGKDLWTAEFNRHPVGTGPFRFKEWTADDKIILERNPDYYEDSLRLCGEHIDRIIATGYDSFSQYFSAFMKGKIDFCLFLNPEQFETCSRDSNYRTYNAPYIATYMIDYNPAHPLFKDKKVRQAIAQAVNIPEMINKVESGFGVQSTGPFLPNAWFSNPEVRPMEYNPAEALKLLKEAGWQLNSNGILETPSPFPLPSGERIGEGPNPTQFRFTLLVDPKERATEQIARIIYQELFKIAIRMDIKACDYDHLDQEPNKTLVKEAGAAVISIRVLAELEPDWRPDRQQRICKLWRYTNPDIDALFEQANITPDLEQRKTLYHKLHWMLYDEQPGTFLYHHSILGAVNKRFSNTDELFSPAMPFYTIKDWNPTNYESANYE